MDEKLLISLGLSQNQARAYRALALKKNLRPAQLAKLTGESRTNCYAILDKLVELELATKSDEDKKLTYYPASPTALKTMLDRQLQQTEQQLANLDRRLPQMLSDYHSGGEQPRVKHHRGKKELEEMYTQQMLQPDRELYFVRTKSDIPFFGLAKMQQIRYLAPKYKKRRYGITPYLIGSPRNPRIDASGNLKRAWVKPEEYTAAVEWVVSGDQVQAIVLEGEGYGISIDHPEIAESFRQVLKLLYSQIKTNPEYKKLPKLANPAEEL
jgi:sugar-specific transcriptional regulator TrmB